MRSPAFCLVHSPLVGPPTWGPVAVELRSRGHQVMVPELPAGRDGSPYWQQHAAAAASALVGWEAGQPLVLVAHSGGGLLLPAIRQLSTRPAARYIFVDAGIPRDGASRLDLLGEEIGADAADSLLSDLQRGERYPQWTDAELQEELPEPDQRHQLLADLRPQGLAFFTEPIPVFEGWPGAPCAYLQFTPGYDGPARSARERGWPYRMLAGGHFQMLIHPEAVADALVNQAEAWS